MTPDCNAVDIGRTGDKLHASIPTAAEERGKKLQAQLAGNAPVPEMPERYFHPAYDNYMYVDYLVERIITTLTRKVAALEAKLKAKGDAGGWIAEGEVQS